MAHGATQVWGTFDEQMRGYRGYPSSLITEDTVRPEGADFAGGYLIQSLGVMPLTFATTLARGAGLWGRELVDALDAYRYIAGIGINAECLPGEQTGSCSRTRSTSRACRRRSSLLARARTRRPSTGTRSRR